MAERRSDRFSHDYCIQSKQHIPRVMLNELSNRSCKKISCSAAGWLIDTLKYSEGVVGVCRSNSLSAFRVSSEFVHESAGGADIRKKL